MSKVVLGVATGLVALAWVGVVSAAAPIDLYNDGPRTETVQAGGLHHIGDLKRGTVYGASTFPLKLTVRPPDALWLGGQTQARTFRFVIFQHKLVRNAQGKVSVWGGGEMAVETAVGKTGSVAQTLENLRATPNVSSQKPVSTRVAGFAGQQFDATVTGAEPGEGGEAFVPFSGAARPGGDHLFVKKGEKVRIIVIAAHGKTVVIYEQGSEGNVAKTFPAFVSAATRFLKTMSLGTKG